MRNVGKQPGLRDEVRHVHAPRITAGELEGQGELLVGVDAVPGDDAHGRSAAHELPPAVRPTPRGPPPGTQMQPRFPPERILMPRSAVTSPSSPMEAPFIARSHLVHRAGGTLTRNLDGVSQNRMRAALMSLPGGRGTSVQRDVRTAVTADAALGKRRPEPGIGQVVARTQKPVTHGSVQAPGTAPRPRRAAPMGMRRDASPPGAPGRCRPARPGSSPTT